MAPLGVHRGRGPYAHSLPTFSCVRESRPPEAVHPAQGALPCHAAPVRDARLRSASSKTRSRFAGPGLLLSLRSIRAAHDGLALPCHAAKRPGRSGAFAATQAKPSPTVWALGFCPRSAPSALAVRFSALLRCHAAAAARRGSNSSDCGKTHPGPTAPPWAFPSAPELARCSARLRASLLEHNVNTFRHGWTFFPGCGKMSAKWAGMPEGGRHADRRAGRGL